MDVTSYLLGKQAGGGGSEINNQDKNVTITTNGSSTITADSGYTGLGTVGITTNVQPNLETLTETITTNGTTTYTPSTGKDGFSSVSITTNVSGGGAEDYFENSTINTGATAIRSLIKKIPDFTIATYYPSFDNMFDGYEKLTALPNISLISTSNPNTLTGNCQRFARDCNSLLSVPSTYDFSGVTNAQSMFQGCSSLTSFSQTNFSSATNVSQLFQSCSGITSFPNLDCSNATSSQQMFQSCRMVTAPNITFTKLQNSMSMFNNCENLENVPIYDTSKIQSFWLEEMFSYCLKLTDTSLDNILQMCINAVNYTGTKKLTALGINDRTAYPLSRIQALPHYQDFIDAGWTIS